MLCQRCNKRAATVHLTQVVNGNKMEMYLCEHCATEKGSMGIIGSSFNFNDFFSGLMGFGSVGSYVMPEWRVLKCDKCGMSYEEFQKVGKLGCGNCYKVFGEQLKPLVKRLHGSTEHTGKAPCRISKSVAASREISKLKELLNKAIQSENYEKAAGLRDKIKSLESN